MSEEYPQAEDDGYTLARPQPVQGNGFTYTSQTGQAGELPVGEDPGFTTGQAVEPPAGDDPGFTYSDNPGDAAAGPPGPVGPVGPVGPTGETGPPGIEGTASGGSGSVYSTLQQAIDGETETVVPGVVPQAGTAAGVLVGPATLSPLDDFYKDFYVVNTDTTPSNGLAAQWARVSSYDGPTRTFTLDKPWNFSAESDVALVLPARVWLFQDTTEDVAIAKSVELNLEGHRIRGPVDVSGGVLQWIRGAGGYVTNGVQKTNFGVLRVDDCTVSRRDATIYALLMTEGSNLGRCELNNSRFSGRVAGRREYSGWNITDCTNLGVTEDQLTNYPYTLVESVAGIAIALSALDVYIDSEFGGAVLHSENSIVGATAYFSLNGVVRTASDYFTTIPVSPKWFSFTSAADAGVLDVTVTSGGANLSIQGIRTNSVAVSNPTISSFLRALNLTGTLNFIFSPTGGVCEVDLLGNTLVRIIEVCGSSDTSGTITFGGTAAKNISGSSGTVRGVEFNARLTGSVTISGGAVTVSNLNGFVLLVSVSNNAGAPTFVWSALLVLRNLSSSAVAFVGASVGAWTFSGNIMMANCIVAGNAFGCSSTTAGGTYLFSGVIEVQGAVDPLSPLLNLRLLDQVGTGGTLTFTGATIAIYGGRWLSVFVARASGAGSTLVVTSPNVIVSGMEATAAATGMIVLAATATSNASLTGVVTLNDMKFSGTQTLVVASAVGGSVTGPAAIAFNFCIFNGAVTTQSGAGTITWTGAALRYRECHVEGLYTVVYTAFTTHEAFHSRFNGASGNKSIAGSGTRPTTLRYWACSFAQRFDDILPEVINVYDILPAQAALVQGQPVFINGANQYEVCVAGSVVDGVLLGAAGAAGTFAVAVRQGRVFVAVDAAVVNGSNLILDVATPTEAAAGAAVVGQEIGTALEAAGATIAGKAYSSVNVR